MVRIRLGIGHHDFTSMGRPSSWHCARPRRLAERAVVVFVHRGINRTHAFRCTVSAVLGYGEFDRTITRLHPARCCDHRKFKNSQSLLRIYPVAETAEAPLIQIKEGLLRREYPMTEKYLATETASSCPTPSNYAVSAPIWPPRWPRCTRGSMIIE